MGVRHAAALGSPIAHSLSPVLHLGAYAALGLDWTFERIECTEDRLAAVLAERADWAGFACTMPLKHAAWEIAGQRTARAVAVGAANTLLPLPGGGWQADNTDVYGIVAALRERGVEPRTPTVLGAGGTAQAALAALAELGVRECTILVRDVTRTVAARQTAHRLGLAVDVAALGRAPLPAGLVVSTLPPGAADAYADQPWSAAHSVLDVIYRPWPTVLAAAAQAGGASVISGALMLLHQAVEQVRLMTGEDAPVEPMRAALRAAAPDCGV